MSKAGEKKKSTRAKHEFITTAAQVVMITALGLMTASAKQINVKLTAKKQQPLYFPSPLR